MRRIRSRFALLVPALAAVLLFAAACEDDDIDIFDDEPTPAATTPTPAPADDTADDFATDDDDAAPAEPAEPTEIRADVEEIDGSGVSGEVIVRSGNGTATGLDDANGLDDDDAGLNDDDDANGTDDGLNGTTGVNGQTEVEVNLSGLDEEANYTHGIFRGSCQDVENGMNGLTDDDDNGLNGMNDDEYMLDPIMVDEDGNVEMTATIDADFQQIQFGHYYAVFENGATGLDNGGQTGTAVACADLEDEDDNGLFNGDDDDNGLTDDEDADDGF
jgi:hypothetical protein